MSKKYLAPLGCTSISIGGEDHAVDSMGVVTVPEYASHADILSHGFVPYIDQPAAAAKHIVSASGDALPPPPPAADAPAAPKKK